MKKKYYLFISIFSLALISMNSLAQTDPVPFNLASGSYSLASWPAASAAGSYPANMVFHYTLSPTFSIYDHIYPGTGDWECPYNLSARSRILGKDSLGFAFAATGSSQYLDCVSDTNFNSGRFVGDAVLGLNTTGRMDIQVSWIGGTVIPGDGSGNPDSARQFTIRLAYRIGNSGLYTDVPGPVEYHSSKISGDMQGVGPVTLPTACNNQPNVQLRWVYYQLAAMKGGTRPQMRVDDINVTSNLLGVNERLSSATAFSIYPNPAKEEFKIRVNSNQSERFVVTIRDILGNKVYSSNLVSNVIAADKFANGYYIVELLNKNTNQSSFNKLIIQK